MGQGQILGPGSLWGQELRERDGALWTPQPVCLLPRTAGPKHGAEGRNESKPDPDVTGEARLPASICPAVSDHLTGL